MNPTLDYLASRNRARAAAAPGRVRQLALADAQAAPPTANAPFAGELALANAIKPAMHAHAYFKKQTVAAAAGFVVLGSAALALPYLMVPSLVFLGVEAFALAGAAISGYYTVFKRYGPSKISEDRLVDAQQALKASDDEHHKPMSLLEVLMMLGIMFLDGFMSGSGLSQSIFQEIFTPRWALVAGAAWGVGATVLLFKLVDDAAKEYAINQRRTVIRNLSQSSDADDQARALAMKRAVGGKLNNDYGTRANKTGARWALVATVLVLSVSTFLMRTGGHDDSAPGVQQPAVQSPAFLRA